MKTLSANTPATLADFCDLAGTSSPQDTSVFRYSVYLQRPISLRLPVMRISIRSGDFLLSAAFSKTLLYHLRMPGPVLACRNCLERVPSNERPNPVTFSSLLSESFADDD